MRTTLARVALTIAASVSIALAGAASVHAATPTPAPDTLGMTIQSKLYADESRDLLVWNSSAVEVAVTLTPSDGWKVTPATLTMAPDETAKVTVTEVGTEPGTLAILATSTGPIPAGVQRTAIELTARLYATRPFDPWPVIVIGTGLGVLLLASIVLGGTWAIRRRRAAARERAWIEARIGGIRQAHPAR